MPTDQSWLAVVVFVGSLLGSLLLGGCASSKHATPGLDTRLEMARTYSAQVDGDALLVWIDGELVLEDYPGDYDPTEPHIVTEISALFPTLVLLKAAGNGKLALDDTVAKFLPEWRGHPQKSKITVRQLLRHTSGLQPGDFDAPPTYEEAIEAPIVHEPGTEFRYGPTSTQVLGALIEGTLGRRPVMKEELFLPLNIPGGRWVAVGKTENQQSARGFTPRLFDGAHQTPRSLLRIGRLLLQNGRWKDKQIIKNMKPLIQPAPASPGFGLGVWLNVEVPSPDSSGAGTEFWRPVPERIMLPRGQERLIYDGAPRDLYTAAGRYNQRLYIIPSLEMVVVRLGRANQKWSDAEFLARLLDGRSLHGSAAQGKGGR
ncbi:MAG: serine hydrolase domain-containing protein [Salinibacter sp.]